MRNLPAKKPTATKPQKSQTAQVLPASDMLGRNPELPHAVATFRETNTTWSVPQLTADEWRDSLNSVEIRDINQRIVLRPLFAAGVFILIFVQSVGVWYIVVWALRAGELKDLQPLLSTLIAGTLTQSYFILRLMTNKVFSDIDYHNGDSKK